MITMHCNKCGWSYSIQDGGVAPAHECGWISFNNPPDSGRPVAVLTLDPFRPDPITVARYLPGEGWSVRGVRAWYDLPVVPGELL